jgi:hypothetical protein
MLNQNDSAVAVAVSTGKLKHELLVDAAQRRRIQINQPTERRRMLRPISETSGSRGSLRQSGRRFMIEWHTRISAARQLIPVPP